MGQSQVQLLLASLTRLARSCPSPLKQGITTHRLDAGSCAKLISGQIKPDLVVLWENRGMHHIGAGQGRQHVR